MGALRKNMSSWARGRGEIRPERPMVIAPHDRHVCEACGELLSTPGMTCNECVERSRPHVPDDPYDDLGGEDGWEA